MKKIWDGVYSHQAYREALNALQAEFPTNYLIAEIPQILSQIHRPKILIRHDIRGSLSQAWAMARLENKLGFRASYMIQSDSPHLDLAQQDAIALVHRIRELGHEIGLHVVWKALTSFPELEQHVERAGTALSHLLGFPIFSVSFSSPPPNIPEDSQFVGSKINATAHVMMKWTLEDSQTIWEIEPARAAVDDPDRALLQVIVRPEAWESGTV
jgi:hypothetical protein